MRRSLRSPCFGPAALVLGTLVRATGPAFAADAGAGLASAGEESLPPPQPLPEYREPAPPAADAEHLARVDARIDALLAPDEPARLAALGRLREVDEGWLPALVARAERVASRSSPAPLEVLLDDVLGRARAGARRRAGARPPAAPVELLERVVRHPERTSGYLRPLTEVLAYGRMLEAIGSPAAARHRLAVYLRWGEFLRIDTERALSRMQDAALPALIEATAHPVPRVAQWAQRQLEQAGKHVASEAIQVSSPALRAEILRAYGKARDAGTARLLIAFAASERAPIRLAARQAVALLGELGLSELRDAYETATGQSAPRDWSWRRVAEQLFARFDAQRLSEVYALFAEGRAAEARGDLEAARRAFDQVLAQEPLFERGALMAPAYLGYAEREAERDPEAAALAVRRAERLAPEGPLAARALSLRYALDARALLERGVVDEPLVRRARELDPNNQRAAALEAELTARSGADRATFRRYLLALATLVAALVALIVSALRLRRSRPARGAPTNP